MSLLAPIRLIFDLLPQVGVRSASRKPKLNFFFAPTDESALPPGLSDVAADEKTWVEDVIARVNTGDVEAFREIVLQYQDFVYALIWRQVRSDDVADDLAQDVFVRVYRHLDSFRGEAKFSTWLARIALNVVKNYFASRAYRERLRSVAIESKHLEQTPLQTPEAQREREVLGSVHVAVAALPEKLRRVVVLCGFEGLSYAQAAEVLRVPLGTVCSRMNAAMRKLRSVLQEER